MDRELHFSRFNHVTPLPDSDDVLLYNFFTGALMRLDPLKKRLFDFADELPEDNAFVKVWAESGFLTALDENEMFRDLTRFVNEKADHDTEKELGLTLHITSLCNFDCPYCFQSRRSGYMSKEIQDAVLKYTDARLSEGGFGTLSVGWFGGEPLLAKDIIDYMGHRFKELAARYGVRYTANIHTNAYLLDQETVDLLEDTGCEFALITIDGYGELHDKTRHLRGGGATFERIISNLSSIRTKKIKLNIRSNLHKGNADSYARLCEKIHEIAALTGNRMLCSPARATNTDAGRARGDVTETISAEEYHKFQKMTDLLERCNVFKQVTRSCHAFRPDDYVVDDLGNVYAHCNQAAIDTGRSYCNIAELDESEYDTIEKKHSEYVQKHYFPDDPKCLSCKLLPVCMGGCYEIRLKTGEPACPEGLMDPDSFILKKYAEITESK